MSVQALSSIAKNVIGQYDLAGQQLLGAWRSGAALAVGAVNRRFAAVVESRSLPLLSDEVKQSLIDAETQVASLLSFGLALPADGAGVAIDGVARRMADRIDQFASTASTIEAAVTPSPINVASKLAMPAAYVSLELANAVVRGSARLSERVGSREKVVLANVEKSVPAKRAGRAVRKA